MKLITRDTDYAIKALNYIARNRDRTVSVSELVKEIKMPGPFLRKILQILNKKGLLRSSKGKGGGFRLVVAPEEIFLVELIEIFQGKMRFNECIFKKRLCPDRNICALKNKIDAIEQDIVSKLQSITLASLKE